MYPIPANATRIRYLESTGTQYVDTGIVPNSATTSVSIRAFLPTGSTAAILFGSRSAANRNAYNALYYPHGSTSPDCIRYDFGDSATAANVQNLIGGVASGWTEIQTSGNEIAITGSGSTTTVTAHLSAASNSFPIFVFGINTGGTPATTAAPVRVSSFRIFESGALVRSFVPVRVGTVGYLFDRVSGQLFGNAGTGDFVLGPDTFSQGVIPTRMMVGGVRNTEVLGSVAFSGAMDSNLVWTDSGTSGPGAFTFSAWVKSAASPTRGAFVKVGNRQVGTTPGAGVGVGFGSTRFDPNYTGSHIVGLAESVAWANSSTDASTITSWHHYAATFSGYALSVYIDGSLFWSNTFSNVRSMSPFVVYIGGNRGGGSGGDTNRFLACNMTRSAMWGRALSAAEVAQDYADGKNAPTTTSGLEHFWPMQNAKNYLKDEVGSATLTAGVGGVTISTDTPFA